LRTIALGIERRWQKNTSAVLPPLEWTRLAAGTH